MAKGNPRNLPTGIAPKTRTTNGKAVPVVTDDGTPVYRVRVWVREVQGGLGVCRRRTESNGEPLTWADILSESGWVWGRLKTLAPICVAPIALGGQADLQEDADALDRLGSGAGW